MRIIGITSESEGISEIPRIVDALDAGVSYIHLRKPFFSDDDMRKYINAIPKEYYQRLTLASNIALFDEFGVGGIHVKHTHCCTAKYTKSVRKSTSCHSIDEVMSHQNDDFDYVFLSPIFDSISKAGYTSRFSMDDLKEISETGLLQNVVALGGINCCNMTLLQQLDIYGVAVLGFLFSNITSEEFTYRLNQITLQSNNTQ